MRVKFNQLNSWTQWWDIQAWIKWWWTRCTEWWAWIKWWTIQAWIKWWTIQEWTQCIQEWIQCTTDPIARTTQLIIVKAVRHRALAWLSVEFNGGLRAVVDAPRPAPLLLRHRKLFELIYWRFYLFFVKFRCGGNGCSCNPCQGPVWICPPRCCCCNGNGNCDDPPIQDPEIPEFPHPLPEQEKKEEPRFPLLENLREGLRNRLEGNDGRSEIFLPRNERYPDDIIIRW